MDSDMPFEVNAGTNTDNVSVTTATDADNLINVQERIFHALFYRIAMHYASTVPFWLRRFHEFIILFTAISSLFTLIYLHTAFSASRITCLDHVRHVWPRNGVVRVEMVRNGHARPYFFISPLCEIDINTLNTQQKSNVSTAYANKYPNSSVVPSGVQEIRVQSESRSLKKYFFSYVNRLIKSVFKDDSYIIEFSLEYGLLRLSHETRERLKIPVMVVELDPDKDKCFGNAFSRMMLREFLGYQDIMISSLNGMFENENHKGYVRNVISGENYRFVNTWVTKFSFIAAFSVMLLFTLSISILLRYSHNQIFLFIVDILHMFEFNVTFGSPAAPLVTVILALIGIEAIMSEFFNDSSTAFYIIIMVWMADQFHTVCCRTEISKKHWLRFFFLYQYSFYAYHVRFNGHYAGLGFFCTFCFVLHSMLYFFNHYELPAIFEQTQNAMHSSHDNYGGSSSVGTQVSGSDLNAPETQGESNGSQRDAVTETASMSGPPVFISFSKVPHSDSDIVRCETGSINL